MKLKTADLIEIYAGLVRLLEAGHKPLEAVRRLGLGEARQREFFQKAGALMEDGASLSRALADAAARNFPLKDRAALEAAETSGGTSWGIW